MRKLINAVILLGVLACMVCAVMFQEWTGLRLGGFFAVPAALLLFLFLERIDNLPKWINR